MKEKPNAVVMWAIGHSASDFIKKCLEKGFKPAFILASGANGEDFLEGLHGVDAEIYVVHPLPNPEKSDAELVSSYKKAAKASGMVASDVALEGYLDAAVLVEGLKRAGGEPTRKGLIKAFEDMGKFNLGGFSMELSPTRHQALTKNYISQVKNAKFVPVE